MVDYDRIEEAKEVILQSNDDGIRWTNNSAKAIFDNFKSIVDQENNQSNNEKWSYLNELKKLIDKKKLSRDIKNTEQDLLAAFWSIDKADIKKLMWNWADEVKKWKDLNKKNKTKESYEDILYRIAKRLYNKNIVLHGEKQKNGWIRPKADIDGNASMLLLKLCGFFKDDNGTPTSPNINFVANGEGLDKWLHLDTNQTINWMKIESKKMFSKNKAWETKDNMVLFNSALTFDEHGDGSDIANKTKKPTSTTHIIYTLLEELWKIPEKYKSQIKRFVDFVDIIDSKYYAIAWADFDNLHRTIVWLHRNLPIEYVYNYFSDWKKTWFEVLSEDFLNNNSNKVKIWYNNYESLKSISEKKRESLNKAEENFLAIDRTRQYLNYKWDTFTIDIWAKISYCPQVSERYGYWCFRLFESWDVYIYSSKWLPKYVWWFESQSPFLIKNMTRDEFNKFLSNFEFNERIQGKEEILKEIDAIFLNLENKDNLLQSKIDTKTKEDLEFTDKVWKLEKISEIEVWKKYKGLVDGVLNNMVHVWLDDKNKGVIHKNQIWNDLFKEKFKWKNKPNRWDQIDVELIDLSNGNQKLQFSIE